jgi:hypothetical protein
MSRFPRTHSKSPLRSHGLAIHIVIDAVARGDELVRRLIAHGAQIEFATCPVGFDRAVDQLLSRRVYASLRRAMAAVPTRIFVDGLMVRAAGKRSKRHRAIATARATLLNGRSRPAAALKERDDLIFDSSSRSSFRNYQRRHPRPHPPRQPHPRPQPQPGPIPPHTTGRRQPHTTGRRQPQPPQPRRKPQPLRHQAPAGVAEVANARVEIPTAVATWAPKLPTAQVPITATTAKPRTIAVLAFARTFTVISIAPVFHSPRRCNGGQNRWFRRAERGHRGLRYNHGLRAFKV